METKHEAWQKTFEGAGDFEAVYAAEDFLSKRGFSFGSMQRDMPRGIMVGNVDIGKWTNCSDEEKTHFVGRMESFDFRSGPVTITLDNITRADFEYAMAHVRVPA